jgi:hypothetical protein
MRPLAFTSVFLAFDGVAPTSAEQWPTGNGTAHESALSKQFRRLWRVSWPDRKRPGEFFDGE